MKPQDCTYLLWVCLILRFFCANFMKKDIKQLYEEYINECQFSKRLRPETIRGYQAVFKTFSKIMPEVVSTKELTKGMMNEFFKRIETRKRIVGRNTIKTGVKNSTIYTYWSKLNCFLGWLYANKHIKENFMLEIKPPEPVYDDDRALEKNDILKIITAITLRSPNALILKRHMLMINILLFCGIRRGEFVALQVRDIDMENHLLTVRPETSKSKRMRRIPLNPTVMMHMREYINERNKLNYKTPHLIVSSTEDRGLTVHGVKHCIKKLEDLSGVDFHMHRFRHSFACNLAKQNTEAIAIQKLLGHKDLEMTQKYLRSLKAEDFRDDVNRLSLDN